MPTKIEFQQSVTVSQAFGKALHLLTSSDFQCVFDDAPLRASHQNFLILARFNQQTKPRLGLVVAKKHLRRAVERNRIKRLVRESFRKQQQSFSGLDVIVLSRKGLGDLSNAIFTEQLNQQWQRIFKKARHLRLTSQPHIDKPDKNKVNPDASATGH